jgi:phosphomevalonate kinase
MKTRNYKDLLVDSHAGADPGFQARGGAHIQNLRENFGVFRVKNHDFKPKNHIFSKISQKTFLKVFLTLAVAVLRFTNSDNSFWYLQTLIIHVQTTYTSQVNARENRSGNQK